MAIVAVTANLISIWDCESTTGAVGNKPVLEPEIKKENANSVGFTSTLDTYAGFDGTIPDLTGQHIRAWYTSITFPNMDIEANGGLQWYMTDGTNTAYWNIAGKDTYQGGYINLLLYADSTPDSGSVNSAAVTDMGFLVNKLTTPKNVTNTWVDYFRYGNGLIVTGGTSGDPITMEHIYQDDILNGYGIIEKIQGVYFVYGSIQVGNGVTTTYFEMDNEQVVFVDANVNAGLYGFNFQGSGCNVVLQSSSIKAAGINDNTRFYLDATDVNLASFSMDGCTLTHWSTIEMITAQSSTNNTYNDGLTSSIGNTPVGDKWNQSGLITIETGGGLDSCVVNEATGAIAVTGVSSSDVVDTHFISSGTGHAFESTVNANQDWANTQEGYGTDDTTDAVFYNNSGGSFDLTVIAGADAPTVRTIANTTVIPVQRTLSIVDLPSGVEVRIRQGSYTLFFEGNITDGSTSYTYTYVAGTVVTISVGGSGYIRKEYTYTLKDADADLSFALEPNPSYLA